MKCVWFNKRNICFNHPINSTHNFANNYIMVVFVHSMNSWKSAVSEKCCLHILHTSEHTGTEDSIESKIEIKKDVNTMNASTEGEQMHESQKIISVIVNCLR